MKYNKDRISKIKKTLKKTLKTLPLFLAVLGTVGGTVGCGNADAESESPLPPLQTIAPIGMTAEPDISQSVQPTDAPATPEPSPEPTPEPTPTPDPGPEPEDIFEQKGWWLWYDKNKPNSQPKGNAVQSDLSWYGAYYLGSDSEQVVYLTFDCGYENGNTELILDALKKHNATGTFFMTGHFLETAPDLVKRIVEEGHIAGNHTYHHPDMTAFTDIADFQKELDDVANLFYEVTGTEISPFYRPPEGNCTKETLQWAKQLGYHTIFWSLAHRDWIQDSQPDPQESIETLSSRVHSGAIVLLHNTSNTNGEIIDDLMTKWEEMGYTFRPLSDLTDPASSTAP